MIKHTQDVTQRPKIFYANLHPIHQCFIVDLVTQTESQFYRHALCDPRWDNAMQDGHLFHALLISMLLEVNGYIK